MRKRYIIAVDVTNAQQDLAVTEYLKAKTGWWWHWIKNIWLTMDNTNKSTAEELRKGIHACVPESRILILEIPEGEFAWNGFGPNSKTDKRLNMFGWLFENWDPKK